MLEETLGFHVRGGLRILEYEGEVFEAGQHGEVGGHVLGWNVPRQRDNEVKIDEVSGR